MKLSFCHKYTKKVFSNFLCNYVFKVLPLIVFYYASRLQFRCSKQDDKRFIKVYFTEFNP